MRGWRRGEPPGPMKIARGHESLSTVAREDYLRSRLREATAPAHDALDAAMGDLDLSTRADYVRFLNIQLNARIGVEEWCLQHCPPDLMPPPQTSLVLQDLARLDAAQAAEPVMFDLASCSEPLGVCWVVAGSSMGNRAMAADLRRRTDGDWPMHFLGNTELPAYFKALRPLIERSYPETRTRSAIAAADAVFAAFRQSWAMQMPELVS